MFKMMYINGELLAEPILNDIIQWNYFQVSGLTREQLKDIGDLLQTSGDISYIANKGTLVVGVTDYAPMSYRDENGEWIGTDCELATILANMLGVEIEFYEMNWDEKDSLLESKTIDCIWNGLELTEERKNINSCSDVYMISDTLSKYTVGFRKDSDLVYLCNDLIFKVHFSGKMEEIMKKYDVLYFFPDEFKLKIGISPDFEPMEYYDENGNLTGFDVDYIKEIMQRIGIEYEIIDMPFDTLLSKLHEGDIDVVISAITVTEDRLKICDFTDEYVVHMWTDEESWAVESYSMGISKGWTGLLDRINSEIELMNVDGTTEILKRVCESFSVKSRKRRSSMIK